jgi:hypothetical protein
MARWVVRIGKVAEIVPLLLKLVGTAVPRTPLFALVLRGILRQNGTEPL